MKQTFITGKSVPHGDGRASDTLILWTMKDSNGQKVKQTFNIIAFIIVPYEYVQHFPYQRFRDRHEETEQVIFENVRIGSIILTDLDYHVIQIVHGRQTSLTFPAVLRDVPLFPKTLL